MSIDDLENHSKTAIHSLVAHFLKSNNYHETLKQFEEEHGKPINPQPLHANESLEEIIKDRINYNELAKEFDNVVDVNKELPEDLQALNKNQFGNWTSPYPSVGQLLKGIDGLVISSSYDPLNNLLFISTNDTKLYIVDASSNNVITEIIKVIETSVIKKIITLDNNEVLLVGIDGKLNYFKYDYADSKFDLKLISSHQAHKRLVVEVKHTKINGVNYFVSLGWDFYLRVFKLSETNQFELISEVKLTGQGSCFDIIEHKNELIIVLGKNDNTLLDVFILQDLKDLVLKYKISLNDAEFSSSSFSPRFLIIQKTSDLYTPLIAVGTSHEPYMRLIIVSLKELDHIDDNTNNSTITTSPIKRNQIMKNLNSLSPQDKYSQSLLSFRIGNDINKCTGIWVAGDDGIIRGIDLIHDKVLVEIEAHKGKIKNFLTFTDKYGYEQLLTGGVERDVKIWKLKN
ncbi:uncharacterized protein RJT21DRAFT_121632 [Scheffersomyces amazonensis]|uniref:uncharacterized protein n=1 Tax=Scheffersomyces amazonensis TaxID=1078765 RepID=UPI00315DD99D